MSSYETSSAELRAVDKVMIWYKMHDDVLEEKARVLSFHPEFNTAMYDNMERLLRRAIEDDARALSRW